MHGKARCIENLEMWTALYMSMTWGKEEITAIMMMNIDRLEIHVCILSTTTNMKES